MITFSSRHHRDYVIISTTAYMRPTSVNVLTTIHYCYCHDSHVFDSIYSYYRSRVLLSCTIHLSSGLVLCCIGRPSSISLFRKHSSTHYLEMEIPYSNMGDLASGESVPFLNQSSPEPEQNLSIKWAESKRQVHSRTHWSTKKRQFVSYFAVFVATTCTWAAIAIIFIRFYPQTVKLYVENGARHSRNTSFFASEIEYLTCSPSLSPKLNCRDAIMTSSSTTGSQVNAWTKNQSKSIKRMDRGFRIGMRMELRF